jgi:hypothetical protein
LGNFSVSGGDPERSPALKWAAEVIQTAPADSAYVCRLKLYVSYVMLAGFEAQKLLHRLKRVQSLLT